MKRALILAFITIELGILVLVEPPADVARLCLGPASIPVFVAYSGLVLVVPPELTADLRMAVPVWRDIEPAIAEWHSQMVVGVSIALAIALVFGLVLLGWRVIRRAPAG